MSSSPEYMKEYRIKNKERIREKTRAYIEKNKEMIKEKRKKYASNNKEYLKKYRKINRERDRKRLKEYRHRMGINKRYFIVSGLSHTKEYLKAKSARERSSRKDLDVKVVQLVYEENIKKHGTLTCYLCLNPIEFGKDHLEHKIPSSRGGTNKYENLSVACQFCNLSKGNRTLEEYKSNRKQPGELP